MTDFGFIVRHCRFTSALRVLALAASVTLVVGVARANNDYEDQDRERGKQGFFCLTVLHNNDAESQLISAPGEPDFGGAARFVTKVAELRLRNSLDRYACGVRATPAVVTLSSGDNFLAGPEFNASLEKGVPFYDSTLIGRVRYDALAIGNHEFDFGPDVLADLIEGIRFGRPPFLSANLDVSDEPRLAKLARRGDMSGSTLIRKRGRKIGIVGATTPELRSISSPQDVVVLQDVAHEVQKEIDSLTKRGADIIIFISHLQGIDEDLALIPQLSKVDIAIAGGGDELLANDGDLLVSGDDPQNAYGPYPVVETQDENGNAVPVINADGDLVPVVTTAGDLKYVGALHALFDHKGNLIEIGENSGLKRVAGGDYPDAVRADPYIQRKVVDPVQASVDQLAENVIGFSGVALEGRRDPGVRTEETNLGNLVADALRWQAGQLAAEFGLPVPDVALQNGGGIRNNNLIASGDITELTTFDILPFSNFVTVVEQIPPQQFKEIMENAVSRVESASGRFAQISGFTMVYDPAGMAQDVDEDGNVLVAGGRVHHIVLDDGTVIVSGGIVNVNAPDLNVATIDFLARGGDQYPFRGAPFTSVGVSYQQALLNYIVGTLAGVITAAEYPEGGEGRITP